MHERVKAAISMYVQSLCCIRTGTTVCMHSVGHDLRYCVPTAQWPLYMEGAGRAGAPLLKTCPARPLAHVMLCLNNTHNVINF